MKKAFRNSTILTLVFCLTISMMPVYGSIVSKGAAMGKSSLVAEGTDGMVSTSHPLATKIGAKVLKSGGNAVDAAVAIQFALNVVEPMMSGIGGGGFMMVYDAETDEVTVVNSRERAPAGATPDMFLDENGNIIPFQERVRSGKSVGVPGTLKGLETALARWGTRPLQQLITPAIYLAEKGFSVDAHLAQEISRNQEKLSLSVAGDVFLPNGEPLQEGEWLIQSDLGKTLRLIRQQGSDVLYEGEVAEAIANVVQDYGGSMMAEDLAAYDVTIDEPVYGSYKGYEIASMPPPSSGGLFLLQMLQILEGFDLEQYDRRSVETYHLLAEAMHLAYADRAAYAGDSEFGAVPMRGLLHPDYIAERRSMIRMDQANPDVTAGDPWAYEDVEPNYDVTEEEEKPEGQTTHFTVADRWGNLVSYTTTIEQIFGSGIMVPGYGLMLNNELTDFDARPGGANEVQPNKRPLSSMTPAIVFKDGQPVLTLGSPGGATIITSVLQVFLNVIEFDMDLQEAIEEPRIYSNVYPTIRWEEGVPGATRGQLEELGHRFQESPGPIGNVQSILINRENGTFVGVADHRRDGAARGVNCRRWRK